MQLSLFCIINFTNYQAIIKLLIVPNYVAYFELIPAIDEAVKKANPDLKCLVPGYCFIEYLEGEYKEKKINVVYCEAVDKMGFETNSRCSNPFPLCPSCTRAYTPI